MSDDDGFPRDMFRFGSAHQRYDLDDHVADGLTSGRLGADDAPPAYAPVAQVLQAARGPVQAHELAGEADAVTRFRDAHENPGPTPAPTPRRRGSVLVTTRVAAVAVVTTLAVGVGVAAAATGHLPDPVQGPAHGLLGHLGVSVPDPADPDPSPAPASPPGTDPGSGSDPAATPPGSPDDPASGEGQGSGTGQGQGPEITAVAHDAEPGVDHGEAVCTRASDGTCRAGEGGPPSTTGRPADPGSGHQPPTSVTSPTTAHTPPTTVHNPTTTRTPPTTVRIPPTTHTPPTSSRRSPDDRASSSTIPAHG